MRVRKIACHRLWREGKVVRNPLVSFDPAGRILSVVECAEPDREPLTEFYAGVMVPDFPAAWHAAFAEMMARRAEPLDGLLSEIVARPCAERCTVIISGVEYGTMQLTEKSSLMTVDS